MSFTISFTTSNFDISQEQQNPNNPIFGEGVLKWLQNLITNEGYQVTDPAPEDWGWYMDVSVDQVSYLVGASGEVEDANPEIEWIVQVDKTRSLKEKIFGKNKMSSDDPLFSVIEKAIRSIDGAQDLQTD
jgi:hypothetical protein